MTKIVVSAETETWTERDPDPDDSWDAGDTAGRVTDVYAWVARDWEQDDYSWGSAWRGDLPVQAGQYVYAVVADYSSGSTFGRDGGYAQVVDVFADVETADALRQLADGYHNDYRFEFQGKEYFANWCGYFESLQDMKVWAVRVETRG